MLPTTEELGWLLSLSAESKSVDSGEELYISMYDGMYILTVTEVDKYR